MVYACSNNASAGRRAPLAMLSEIFFRTVNRSRMWRVSKIAADQKRVRD